MWPQVQESTIKWPLVRKGCADHSFTCSIPPISITASRRATDCESPCSIFSCVRASSVERSSSSRACSIARLRKRFRNKLRIRLAMIPPLDSSGLNGGRHDLHHLVPLPLFILELSAPRRSQPIIFCAAVVVGRAPLGFYPAFFLHAVQH